jgi:hypothetical protein
MGGFVGLDQEYIPIMTFMRYTYIYIYKYIYICINIYIYIYIYFHLFIYMQIYIHTHIPIYNVLTYIYIGSFSTEDVALWITFLDEICLLQTLNISILSEKERAVLLLNLFHIMVIHGSLGTSWCMCGGPTPL